MIHCIGEILLDMFEETNGRSTKLSSKVGGAPFNVAANIALSGGESSFYGVIGDDKCGDLIEKEANKYPLQKLWLDRKKDVNTTLAIVTVTNGERSFRFRRSPGADYLLDIEKLPRLGIERGDIVHFGSLMLSKKEGREFVKKAIAYCHRVGAFLSFDANLRLDIYKDEDEAKKIYGEIFPHIDILKLSDDELCFFGKRLDPKTFYKENLPQKPLLFVSYGEKGSALYTDSISHSVPSIPIKSVDTTGAGDAFYARVLMELDRSKDPFSLGLEAYEEFLRKANAEGAKAVSHYGALPTIDD